MDKIIIMGAGISGLGAGYSLRRKGISAILLEKDFTYDTGKVKAFLVPAGTAVEVFATTLH